MKRTKVYTFAALVVAGALWLAAPLTGPSLRRDVRHDENDGAHRHGQGVPVDESARLDSGERGQGRGAKEEWSFEGGSPNTLSRQGWKKSTFAPGAQVTIRFNPMRDGTHAGQFVAAKFADGKTLGRWE